MSRHRIACAALALVAALVSTSLTEAGVIPSSLEVDFRAKAWSGANWQHTYAVGDVTATANPSYKLLWQDSTDGLGIRGGSQADEIELSEILEVDFANGGKVLSGVYITDLFDTPDGGIGEKGIVVINGTMVFKFDGNLADQVNGELFVSFGGNVLVQSAVFYADNTAAGIVASNNEFSVAGFAGVAPGPITVTEPNALGLLALSFVGLLTIRQRRRQSA